MIQDPPVPQDLCNLQEWFGTTISRPIDKNSRIAQTTPSGRNLSEEASARLLPSHSLAPSERIEIYAQQYWWRLLGALHDQFPLVVRLFGYRDFNETIGKPYLSKHPPNHWSLQQLGNCIVSWANQEYHSCDRPLVLDALALDWAYLKARTAPHMDSIKVSAIQDCETLYTSKASLQEHITLLTFTHDLCAFRDQLLECEVDHWQLHPFPSMRNGERYHFILFRTCENSVVYRELPAAEFHLLQQLQQGQTIDQLIEWLEKDGKSWYDEATMQLTTWISSWLHEQWLTFK